MNAPTELIPVLREPFRASADTDATQIIPAAEPSPAERTFWFDDTAAEKARAAGVALGRDDSGQRIDLDNPEHLKWVLDSMRAKWQI